jgi:hypothetical protein
MNKLTAGFGLGSLLASLAAFAAPGAALDVTDVTGTMTAQIASLTLVGGGILAVVVIVAAIAWMRRPIH